MLKTSSTFFSNLRHLSLLIPILWISGCAIEEVDNKFEIPVYPSPPDEPRFYYEATLTSSADVIPADSDAEMKYFLTGAGRTGQGMTKPYDIVVRQGTVYVSDPVQRQVLVFDKTGKRFFRIGEKAPGQLRKPFGIDMDAQGNLYVVDSTLKKVFIYDSEGKFIKTIGSEKMFLRPTDVAVTPDASKIFVSDTGGVSTQKHRIRVFDVKTKEHLFDIGSRGNKDGEFNLPKGVTINKADGLLYVVDSANFRVQAFNPDNGQFVKKFGSIGRVAGKFARPKDISSDSEGNVYVTDAAFGNFQIFNPKGQLLLFVGSRNVDNAPGKFMLPSGIFVDEDGRVLMADQYFRKIDIFRPAQLDTYKGYLGMPAPNAPEATPKSEEKKAEKT